MRDGVIVLHGIFRTHRSMRKLANFLEKDGFEVLNLGCPSTKHSIESIADGTLTTGAKSNWDTYSVVGA